MKKTIVPTTSTTSSRVYPKFSCKYYVYGLFKPNGVLFYVGKGKGSRINDHFKPSNLKVKSPKASIINKYGDSIVREIFEYFDDEDQAYSHEEKLISQYGLLGEGGILTNYAKTRYQYSDRFKRDVCQKGSLNRKRTYSEHTIVKAYVDYFTKCKTIREVSRVLNIDRSYLNYCLRGIKNKVLYSEYVLSGLVKVNQHYAQDLKTMAKHKLKKRQHKENKVHQRMLGKQHHVVKLREQGLSYGEIMKQTGFPKTTVARLINSASNLDNK